MKGRAMTFFGYLAESSGNDLTDSEIADLVELGILDLYEVGKVRCEKLLGIQLVPSNKVLAYFYQSVQVHTRTYSIVDLGTVGSSEVFLSLRYSKEGQPDSKYYGVGKPILSKFRFYNVQGVTIPLSCHSENEVEDLIIAGWQKQHYFTPIGRLTREVYLSAVENRYYELPKY